MVGQLHHVDDPGLEDGVTRPPYRLMTGNHHLTAGTLVRMVDGTLAEVINMAPQDGWNISVRPLADQEIGVITHRAHLTVVPPDQDPMLL